MTTPRRTGPRPPRPSASPEAEVESEVTTRAKIKSRTRSRDKADADAESPAEAGLSAESQTDSTAEAAGVSWDEFFADVKDWLQWARRRILPWVVAPLSMLLVFVIGLAATWLPSIPRVVTSPVGPTLGAIGEPLSIEIPSLKIKARVVPIELTKDDVLNPPADIREVGWWKRSAQPGATNGQTLMTGHAVHTGGGVMDNLGDVHRGASVLIKSKDKTASYLVQKVFVWSKDDVAVHSEDLFDPTFHERRLVLVTCADWDGKVWESNVIVYAQPA